ncbi:MAG: hypothetical protein ACE5GX_11020 [Thermoanaerobaculia bacterium]
MKKWPTVIAVACALVVPGQAAFADQHEGRVYLDEEYEEQRDWSLGLGLGLVDIGESIIDQTTPLSNDDVEQYLTLNLRIPFGERHAHAGSSRGGFRGYLEPELGFWEGDFSSNLSVGVNIIGGMPFNAVEFFVGGGIGMHFLDTDFPLPSGDTSEDSIGINAQFGVDLSVSRAISVFAVSRFDLVDDSRDQLETKAAVGLRFRF